MKSFMFAAALGVLTLAAGFSTIASAHQRGYDYDYDAYAPTHGTPAPFTVLRAPQSDSEPSATATGGPAGGLPDKN